MLVYLDCNWSQRVHGSSQFTKDVLWKTTDSEAKLIVNKTKKLLFITVVLTRLFIPVRTSWKKSTMKGLT